MLATRAIFMANMNIRTICDEFLHPIKKNKINKLYLLLKCLIHISLQMN